MSEIYPQSVFENQTNGTVFYKEGKLNDPMMPNKAGVFESWRYSFDNGRQVFKETNGDKVYEKRIIKDKFGNPRWSEWMEISEAENGGVKAIAINDRPLLLPNSDGAIKLQITPQMIDTYTKREIQTILDKKVADINSNGYKYVKWDDTCNTAYECVAKAYSEGGMSDIHYIVEPKPVKGDIGKETNKASYFIWDYVGDGSKFEDGYDFVEVDNSVDMRAFVSYSAFNEHANDDVAHITAEERTKWNEAKTLADGAVVDIKTIYDKLKKYNEDFIAHINSIGSINSMHLTQDERARLNSIFQNVKQLPTNDSRYVVENGEYVEAYEQAQKSTDTETKEIKDYELLSRPNGTNLVVEEDNLKKVISDIKASNNVIARVYFQISEIQFMDKNSKFFLTSDTGFTSSTFAGPARFANIDIPLGAMPTSVTLNVISDSDNASPAVVFKAKLFVEYAKKLAVDIGDQDRLLGVNLIGPEGTVPSYNGTPITDLMKDSADSAKWGSITGNIDLQTDIDKKIAKAVAKKLSYGDTSSASRFDVYKTGLIKSICQQDEGSEETTVEIKAEDGAYTKGRAIISGVAEKISELSERGFVAYKAVLTVQNVAVLTTTDGDKLPVYFTTDNPAIEQSGNVVGAFTWDWPGDTFLKFDKIYLNGNDAEYITNAKLTISAVKYGDITIGMTNATTSKPYSIKITANDLLETAATIELEASDIAVKAAQTMLLSASGVLSVGGKAYSYDDAKDDNAVNVYGEEIDQRYASRAKLEKAVEDAAAAAAALIQETEDRKAADEALTDTFDSKITEVKGDLQQQIDEANQNARETLKEASDLVQSVKDNATEVQANVEKEAEYRKAADDAIKADLSDTNDALDAYKTSNDAAVKALSDKIDFESKDNAESFDLVINSSEELTEAVADGSFERAERILFKKGHYALTGSYDASKVLDFSSIKYVKGEGAEVELSLGSPVHYEETKFENIGFICGKVVIADNGERTFETSASGATTVKLLKEYSVYKIKIEDNASITFEDAIDGKDYIFYIDQDDVKNVKITNFTYNSNDEFAKGLENQKENARTVIKATCSNTPTQNSFIINEVIYGVLYKSDASQSIDIIAKNTKVALYKTSDKVEAVSFNENEVVGTTAPSMTFTLSPKILDGFAHADDGADYTVELADGTLIGEGRCDKPTTFKTPDTVAADEKIYVRFNLKPQLVTVFLNDVYTKYFSKKTGFVQVQAGRRAEVTLETVSGITLVGVQQAQLKGVYEGDMPYQFTPAIAADRLDYSLEIKPVLYADFDGFTLSTVSDKPFDKTKVALVGKNDFLVEPEFIYDVKNDENFGVLYTAAPIELLSGEGYTGSVSFTDNGVTQAATVTFDEALADSYVDLKFVVAKHQNETVTKHLFIGKIVSTMIVSDDGLEQTNGKYILNSYASSGQKFGFTADLKGVNDFSGTWSVTDNGRGVVAIDSFKDNKIVLTVSRNGTATLQFTSAFTGLAYSVSVESRVYAKSIKCSEVLSTTDATIVPAVQFFDAAGDAIEASKLYNASFTYTSDSEYLNAERGSSIYVNNALLPEGESSVTAEYTVVQDDATLPAEISAGSVKITAKKFKVSFTVAETSKITLVSIIGGSAVLNNSCYASAGATLSVIIKLRDDAQATASTAILREAFGEASASIDSKNYYVATVRMPAKNVSFALD